MSKTLNFRDWEKVELYLKAGAKPWKIAKSFNLTNTEFKEKLQEKYGKDWETVIEGFNHVGEMLIEATQFQKALAGNITLLIWLGKVRCGQREPDIVSTTPPAQNEIDKDHLIMQLQHQIQTLTDKLDKYGHKSETE